jgi:hypothetical protein
MISLGLGAYLFAPYFSTIFATEKYLKGSASYQNELDHQEAFFKLVGGTFLLVALMIILFLYLQGEIILPFLPKNLGVRFVNKKSEGPSTSSRYKSTESLEKGKNMAANEDIVFQNQIQHAIEGLTSEVERTRLNSHVNLIIGVATTISAVVVLFITLLGQKV